MLEKTSYNVRIDACPLWTQHRVVTFGMCMGNDYWEGEKFLALLEWAEGKFDRIRVALSDTLGRHNIMMAGVDAAQAEYLARAEGDQWLARHKHDLERCGKPISVVRWDHWRQQADFQETLESFTWLSQENPDLRRALDSDIQTYQQRYLRRGVSLNQESEKFCRAYLLEELAGTTLRARAMPNSCRVYPAPDMASSRLVRAGLVPGAPRGLEGEYYVAINLRRRSSSKAADSSSSEGQLLAA